VYTNVYESIDRGRDALAVLDSMDAVAAHFGLELDPDRIAVASHSGCLGLQHPITRHVDCGAIPGERPAITPVALAPVTPNPYRSTAERVPGCAGGADAVGGSVPAGQGIEGSLPGGRSAYCP